MNLNFQLLTFNFQLKKHPHRQAGMFFFLSCEFQVNATKLYFLFPDKILSTCFCSCLICSFN